MEKSTGEKIKSWLTQSLGLTGRYILARLLMALISGAVCAVAFALLGVPLWGLMALAVGLGNLVPYFGAWVSAIITGLVSFFMADWRTAVWALLVILLLQGFEEFVLEPLILGRALDFKPLAVFLVVMAAGAVFGFWGIVLAMPAAAVLKLAYQIFYLKKDPSAREKDGGDGKQV